MIDATDWGHIVGEIEVMVTDQQQIAEASKRIEDLGKELGTVFEIFLRTHFFFFMFFYVFFFSMFCLDFSPMDLNVLYHKICK